MKEYGSNIQKLVEHLQTITEREKRTRHAHILVELMRQIHPNMRDNQDYYNKLWDDLYIMSGFTLDVDSPYPPPPADILGRRPQRVPYNAHKLRYKHYGCNMDLLIAKAITLENLEERRAFVSYLARLMKTFYISWNKEAVEEETILQNLEEMSNGLLHDDIQLIRTDGFVEATPRERTGDAPAYRIGGPGSGSNRPYGGGYPNQSNRDTDRRENRNDRRDNRNDGSGYRDRSDRNNDRFRTNPNNRRRR